MLLISKGDKSSMFLFTSFDIYRLLDNEQAFSLVLACWYPLLSQPRQCFSNFCFYRQVKRLYELCLVTRSLQIQRTNINDWTRIKRNYNYGIVPCVWITNKIWPHWKKKLYIYQLIFAYEVEPQVFSSKWTIFFPELFDSFNFNGQPANLTWNLGNFISLETTTYWEKVTLQDGRQRFCIFVR